MAIQSFQLLGVLAAVGFSLATALASTPLSTREADYKPQDIITRDFCVIGGGSSGTYAALGLKDRNKTVVVIEKEDRLGGHANTYVDPATGYTLDYGVAFYDNVPIVQSYYARFNIPLFTLQLGSSLGGSSPTVDFTTGKPDNFTQADPTVAIETYAGLLAQYPYLTNGYDLPDPVPSDLLLPFGDFVTKYSLQNLVFIAQSICQGIGDLLKVPTLYVMKYWSATVLNSSFTGFLATVHHDNSEIYDRAMAELGSNVLLQSHVGFMIRSSQPNAEYPITIVASTPKGPKLIRAKKLIVAIPQKLNNLCGFDLDARERSIFAEFKNAYYWTTLLNNTNLPAGSSFTNANPNNPYNLPAQPGAYDISETQIAGIFSAIYGSATYLSDEAVKASIIDEVSKLRNDKSDKSKPDFVEFKNHSPFVLQVSAEQIAKGFYKDLYALQGYRGTWYTGAAFAAQDSSAVWRFTESLLARIVA